MNIASEIQRLQTAKADIKAALEGKGIPVSSKLKIDGYAELIESIVPDIRVVAKFNVTDTSNPTQLCYDDSVSQFRALEIDGVAQPSVVDSYTFTTTGIHTVRFTLADPTSIGGSAFYNCSKLTSVTIGGGVTRIGDNAFYGCFGLTSVSIPNSVTSIGNGAFWNCSALTSVSIPNSVTSIGNGAFRYCSRFTSVSIPDSVTSIEDYTFYNCSKLTSVTIGGGVTRIGDNAFRRCTGLNSIISNATTAPTILTNTFRDVKSGGTLTVPSVSSGYDVWMGRG